MPIIESLASITDAIKSNVQVTDIEKSFADGVGTLKITRRSLNAAAWMI